MTAITDPAPIFRPLLGRLSDLFRVRPAVPPESPEEARARRELVQEMIAAHPEAFQSELDLMAMLHSYPGRF